LQEENAKLKKLLETGGKLDGGSVPANGGGADVDTDEEAALKKQLEENNKAMENMAKTYEEKLKQAQEQVYYICQNIFILNLHHFKGLIFYSSEQSYFRYGLSIESD